ncbi:MAG: sigma-70 family RNA polymerase sigma factor [bacterium]|nr:sigma-70 family RNA polymerase sigma factor [bacterium]
MLPHWQIPKAGTRAEPRGTIGGLYWIEMDVDSTEGLPNWTERLLDEQAFLHRLARGLVADEASAEDLVQEANVRALVSPPREGATTRAWLTTVTRRLASHGWRSDARRDRRERAGARAEATDGDLAAVDGQLDAHAELLDVMRDLPAEQRRALFLRYAQDLAPRAIADQLGVSVDTVKTRLRRGRQRLRATLDERHGERKAWAALLVGAPGTTLRESAPLAALASTWIPTFVMSTSLKITAAAGAAAFALWLAVGADPAAPSEPISVAETDPARIEAQVEARADLAAARTEREERTEVDGGTEPAPAAQMITITWPPEPAPDPGPAWWLDIQTVGAPGAGSAVSVRAWRAAYVGDFGTPLETTLDANGSARVDIGPHLRELAADTGAGPPREIVVSVEPPDALPAEVRVFLPDPLDATVPPPEPLRVEVPLQAAGIVVGRVVASEPVAEGLPKLVLAFLLKDGVPERGPSAWIHPDEDGSFRLRLPGAGKFALLAIIGGHRPTTHRIELATGRRLDVGDVLVDKGLAIVGRVLGDVHDPVSISVGLRGMQHHVETDLFSFDLPMTYAWHMGRFELFGAWQEMGEGGAFRIDALGPHAYDVRADAPNVQVPFDSIPATVCTPPATLELRRASAHVVVRLELPDGELGSGVARWKLREPAGDSEIDWHQNLQPGELNRNPYLRPRLPAEIEAELLLEVAGLEPATLVVQTPRGGETLEVDLVLRRTADTARLALKLTGIETRDGDSFNVRTDLEDGTKLELVLQAKGGELVVPDLPPGRAAVYVSPGEDWLAPQDHVREAVVEIELTPGERASRVVRFERGGSLVLEALDAAGKRVDASVEVYDKGERLPLTFVAWGADASRVAGGNMIFALGPSRAVPELTPGTYRVRVHASGHEPFETNVVIRAGQTTQERIQLQVK